MTERKIFAVYVITKHGLKTAEVFKREHPDCDLYVSKRFIDKAPPGSFLLATPMGPTLKKTWKEYDCHIHIISVGAVVRMIAPLLENKKVDPAVICIDDANKFSICLLSGHVGRGNEFTKVVSDTLNNTPVITTASDVTGTLTVDILGRDLGWELDDKDRNVTLGCAAVVNQSKVAFIQETGEPNFWPLKKPLPPGVNYFTKLEDVNPKGHEILLICSDQNIIERSHWEKAVIYRPKSLVLGLGCDKGTPFEVVEQGILHHLEKMNLSVKSVKAIATIDLKENEEAFLKLKKKYGWIIEGYPAKVLDQVEGVLNPSDVVKKYVGTRSVGEAACLHFTKSKMLLLPKQKFQLEKGGKNMTISIARIPFLKRGEHGHS
ncbi:cobalamin biosynthesis protein [Bacteriovoracales bacterium]|nr:cobalamin biosynthesis protein [Bacteriovoracales bacterium]